MINEEFEVTVLAPVKCEQAEIMIKSRKWKRAARVKKPEKPARGAGILDMLIKQSVICFIVLIMFAAINFVGLDSFLDNVSQVIENRGISEYFTNADFV